MKTLSKVLCLLMVAVMCMSFFGASASAFSINIGGSGSSNSGISFPIGASEQPPPPHRKPLPHLMQASAQVSLMRHTHPKLRMTTRTTQTLSIKWPRLSRTVREPLSSAATSALIKSL